jgi:1-acyl-sn-glycerol-3-phosphate acyltransferase
MNPSRQTLLVTLFRAIRLVLHLFYGVSLAIVYPHFNRKLQLAIQRRWSQTLLSIFNIPMNVQGAQFASCPSGCLQIANHVSWMDIFVLNAIQPSHFIAKSEVRDWPIIGWLCTRAGTLFIERASRQGANTINHQIVEKLTHGERVGLFPEGTTTDGSRVGTFRPALVQPAIDASAVVSPVTIRYLDDEGNLSLNAPFTGDTTLVESIWNMLNGRQIIANVSYARPLQATGENRRALSTLAHSMVAENLTSAGRARRGSSTETRDVTPHGLLARPAFVLLFDATLYQLPD